MAGLWVAAAMAAATAATQPAQVHQFQALAISPDGGLVAAVETDELREAADDPHGAVVVRDRASGAVVGRYDPCATCAYGGVSWSPDGKAMAFVSSDHKAIMANLLVVRAGKLDTVATLNGIIETPRWSPDGSTLAVLATARPHKEIGATQPGAALVGEIGSVVDEQRIAVAPAAGGPLRFVSPADTFVYEYDWSPDGRGFVATEAKGDGDNNWWVAKLASVALADGALHELAAPALQMKFPRVSPDGKTVAFIGGLHSDFGPSGGDLYTVPIAGGAPVNRTPGFKGSFSSLTWLPRGLYATALIGDASTVLTVDPASGATKTLWAGQSSIAAGDARIALSRDGRYAATVSETFSTPPHIGAGPIAAVTQITHDNDALVAQTVARSISWKSEGFDVQGWLLAPPGVQAGKTYPMVVQVHGGPSAAAQPSFLWKGPTAALLAQGDFVFLPNPRGSFGQGEAFVRANVRDFGGGDLRDILAGVDAVEKVAPVDDKRLGVYGHSYGGFMTMWTVTHSQRFKAAVAGAGIANWISYYGQNGIDQWMIPFFGASAYDDPAIYDALSPIRSIKAAKTPTFIYVGERDVECPPAQSVEFWHGLEAMRVPNSLVIYAGEGHGIRGVDHKADLERRIAGWFGRYLGQP